MDNLELRDLVEAPRERLDAEYKAWLNLSDNESRAKIARHICALANFGGGYLVFGINDDMTPSGPPYRCRVI
jgi:predicted HTH transcriptional regulator